MCWKGLRRAFSLQFEGSEMWPAVVPAPSWPQSLCELKHGCQPACRKARWGLSYSVVSIDKWLFCDLPEIRLRPQDLLANLVFWIQARGFVHTDGAPLNHGSAWDISALYWCKSTSIQMSCFSTSVQYLKIYRRDPRLDYETGFGLGDFCPSVRQVFWACFKHGKLRFDVQWIGWVKYCFGLTIFPTYYGLP